MANELIADYVVVGSGAGGGPLACRLALAGHEVLVLEAGHDRGETLNYQVPAFHGQASEDPDRSWAFFVQHYADKARQSEDYDPKYDKARGGIFYPRAAAVGGCTTHHAMITIYPHNSDWQALADLTGDPSWKPDNMRRLFEERLERCGYRRPPLVPGVNPTRHGFNGWLSTEQADPGSAAGDAELVKVILSAAAETLIDKLIADHQNGVREALSLLLKDPAELVAILAEGGDPRDVLKQLIVRHLDPNDWAVTRTSGEGVFSIPLAISKGHRRGPREFLMETRAKVGDKLRIVEGALATRVIFDKSMTATGVEFLTGDRLYGADTNPSEDPGQPGVARARREVILAGGTFNTPQLLMLSGVGPREHLEGKDIGIDCRVNLPGVGKNLQDRYEVGVISEMKGAFKALGCCAFKAPAPGGAADPCLAQWQKDGTGLYSTNGAVLAVIRRSRPDLPDPDLFLFGIPGTFKGYFVHYSDAIVREPDHFTWAILKAHTHNTAGTVELTSRDPRAVPRINFRYFDEGTDKGGDDLRAVAEGVKLARQIMEHRSLAGRVTKTELLPGGAIGDDASLQDFVKRVAWGHHACGTCKMGRKTADGQPPADDPNAVVDGDFRVYGTRNLRVVDASVFPKIPGFFIVTSVYLISEKASDAILGGGQKNTTNP